MPLLEIKNLHFRIGATNILCGVNLTIKKGEVVGLIGPNGSGKTTLFNCISGFSKIHTGEIILAETEITHRAPHQRAHLGLGRVFQNCGIFKEMTVLDNLIIALESRQSWSSRILPWSSQSKTNIATAQGYLKDIGLHEKAKDKAGSLSGGQMRLLEIMRALAYGAELFLLDEPTAGVAPKMKEDVAELINKLQELNQTALIIEHDITFIQKFCDRVLVMNEGKIVLDDTPQGVRADPLLHEIYFGKTEGYSSPRK